MVVVSSILRIFIWQRLFCKGLEILKLKGKTIWQNLDSTRTESFVKEESNNQKITFLASPPSTVIPKQINYNNKRRFLKRNDEEHYFRNHNKRQQPSKRQIASNLSANEVFIYVPLFKEKTGVLPVTEDKLTSEMLRAKTISRQRVKSSTSYLKNQVLVTIRIKNEVDSENLIWNVSEQNTIYLNNHSTNIFKFDNIVTSSANYLVYTRNFQKIIASSIIDGLNGIIMAYGQTNSGKTYTMSGKESKVKSEKGLIQYSIEDIFSIIEEQKQKEYRLKISYVEIYNETIKDLLNPLNPVEIKILIDKETNGTYMAPIKHEFCLTQYQVLDLIKKGEANRQLKQTDGNFRSSRSHTILQITVDAKDLRNSFVTHSRIVFCDLAGSEKLDSNIFRRKEGSFINKSLLALGNCISKLSDPKEKDNHIPYRDSKLTRILQNSLSGNSLVGVICTISARERNKEESLSTLKFAQRIKNIPINATKGRERNVDQKELIKIYKDEIKELKEKLVETDLKLAEEKSKTESLKKQKALINDGTKDVQDTQIFDNNLFKLELIKCRLSLVKNIKNLENLYLSARDNEVVGSIITDHTGSLDSVPSIISKITVFSFNWGFKKVFGEEFDLLSL
ncbi:hypothetical protein HDU92_008129 [Lobulomyces angularis]|nr:hypothetical protein HDU92_008129 [Lobulomyces angularis]